MAYSDKQKEKILNDVCERISKGEAVRNILSEKEFPCHVTFFKWLDSDEKKVTQYVRACESRQDHIFEEMLEISNTPQIGYSTTETEKGVITNTADMLGHRKLQIETRKWMLGKMNPKKYSDKLDLTSDGEKLDTTPKITIIHNDKQIDLSSD